MSYIAGESPCQANIFSSAAAERMYEKFQVPHLPGISKGQNE